MAFWVQVSASLGRFIPKYFILFVAMINGIVSLISLSYFSLFIYRSTRDFYVLILYPVAFQNSLFSSRSLLLASLGFSTHNIMSSVNIDTSITFGTKKLRTVALKMVRRTDLFYHVASYPKWHSSVRKIPLSRRFHGGKREFWNLQEKKNLVTC